MTEQTDHAPSTPRFVDKWIMSMGIGHELEISEQTFYQWRVKHAGPEGLQDRPPRSN